MKILSINIKGLGGATKVRMLRNLLRQEDIDFIALQETGLSDGVENIVRSIWTQDDYEFSHSPACGRSGGLLYIWRKTVFKASVAFAGQGFLYVSGLWKGLSNEVTFFNVYGPHNDSARKRLWADLLAILQSSADRSCLMGDFNVVRNQDERKGSTFYHLRATTFNEFIHSAGLLDMNLGGRRFTWIGMGGTKLTKLDRFLISPALLHDWPSVSLVALERLFADHCPRLLKSNTHNYGPTPFRFFDH